MKRFVILFVILFVGCTRNNLKITLDSDPCKDTQVFIELAEDMRGWFNKDSKAATMALTLATGAYQNCLAERRNKK